jgi:hypothetical protein
MACIALAAMETACPKCTSSISLMQSGD